MLKSTLALKIAQEFGYTEDEEDEIAIYGDYIDEAILELVNEYDWNINTGLYDGTILTGNAALTLDQNISKVRLIQRKDTFAPIPYREFSQLQESGLDLTESGSVECWTHNNLESATQQLTIRWYRIPAEDIEIFINAEKQQLIPIADNEHIPFNDHYIPVIKNFVRALANKVEDKNDSAAYFDLKFERSLARLNRKFSGNDAAMLIALPNSDLRSIFTNDGQTSKFSNMPFVGYPSNYPAP